VDATSAADIRSGGVARYAPDEECSSLRGERDANMRSRMRRRASKPFLAPEERPSGPIHRLPVRRRAMGVNTFPWSAL
jgi:hypothetical protein